MSNLNEVILRELNWAKDCLSGMNLKGTASASDIRAWTKARAAIQTALEAAEGDKP